MHIFFSGIGGAGIGPLALIAKQAGYDVSGSDASQSQYTDYLAEHGIDNIYIGQSMEQIEEAHGKKPIDWLVHSSAIDPESPEMVFCHQEGIRSTKRDEFLNEILRTNSLKLIAVAGTHGKTTTTAMVVWVFKQLGLPISYSVGGKISFGDMSAFDPKSQYFAYECDEFDRNFLAFHPSLSILPGLGWDHHEIFPTEEDYLKAFSQFVKQSNQVVAWDADAKKLNLLSNFNTRVEDSNDPNIEKIKLVGLYNRRDAWLVIQALLEITQKSPGELIEIMSGFPGVSRRFEKLTENLYTDYAHTPQKIQGVMSVALETAQKAAQKIVIIYEPLTNRRMHNMKDQHQDIFDGVDALYWVPSYLAREDSNQPVLSPAELIKYLDAPAQAVAQPMELDSRLKIAIDKHLDKGDLVIGLSGGGSNSLDEWLRKEFS